MGLALRPSCTAPFAPMHAQPALRKGGARRSWALGFFIRVVTAEEGESFFSRACCAWRGRRTLGGGGLSRFHGLCRAGEGSLRCVRWTSAPAHQRQARQAGSDARVCCLTLAGFAGSGARPAGERCGGGRARQSRGGQGEGKERKELGSRTRRSDPLRPRSRTCTRASSRGTRGEAMVRRCSCCWTSSRPRSWRRRPRRRPTPRRARRSRACCTHPTHPWISGIGSPPRMPSTTLRSARPGKR